MTSSSQGMTLSHWLLIISQQNQSNHNPNYTSNGQTTSKKTPRFVSWYSWVVFIKLGTRVCVANFQKNYKQDINRKKANSNCVKIIVFIIFFLWTEEDTFQWEEYSLYTSSFRKIRTWILQRYFRFHISR